MNCYRKMYLCACALISLVTIGSALPASSVPAHTKAKTTAKSLARGQLQTKEKVKHEDHLELIRKIFPDSTKELYAESSVIIRHIRGDYDPEELTGPMRITEEGCYTVTNGSHRDCVLVLDISHTGEPTNPWGGETLLALFRMQPSPRLIDVADIQMDRESGMWTKPPILHGRNHDALVTYYCHLNASEEYMAPSLIEIVKDKFVQSKAELPMAFSARTATDEIVESASFVLPRKTTGPVIFRMKMVGKKLDEETQKALKSESKTFSFPLIQRNGRWHSVSDSKPCRLMEQMQERFGFAR